MRKIIPLAAVAVFAVFASSCSQRVAPVQTAPPDHRAADAAVIRSLDAEWVNAAKDKDAAKFVSFYARNATLLPPGGPMTSGKEAISEAWKRMLAEPGFALTFATDKVEVARSGDMAYELGDYTLTVNDAHGHPQTSKGKYVVVWGKQADGTWKAMIDAPTTTE